MGAYLVIFAAGFAGSFHCIGMCGGFACALGRDPHGLGTTLQRHLLYNLGRLSTYCFLGALFGTLMGLLIRLFQLPPFLVTLAGMFLARGLGFVIAPQSVGITHRKG